MKKRILAIIALLTVSCAPNLKPFSDSGLTKIVCTTYTLQEITDHVTHGAAETRALFVTPDDIAAHRITPAMVKLLHRADYLIAFDAETEPWADELIQRSGNLKLAVLRTSDVMPARGYEAFLNIENVIGMCGYEAYAIYGFRSDMTGKLVFDNLDTYEMQLRRTQSNMRAAARDRRYAIAADALTNFTGAYSIPVAYNFARATTAEMCGQTYDVLLIPDFRIEQFRSDARGMTIPRLAPISLFCDPDDDARATYISLMEYNLSAITYAH